MGKINDNSPLNAEQVKELKSEAAKALNVNLSWTEEEVSGMRLAVFLVKADEEETAEDKRRAVNLFMFQYCNKHGWPASFAVDAAVVRQPVLTKEV